MPRQYHRPIFGPYDLAVEILAYSNRARAISARARELLETSEPDTFLGRQHYRLIPLPNEDGVPPRKSEAAFVDAAENIAHANAATDIASASVQLAQGPTSWAMRSTSHDEAMMTAELHDALTEALEYIKAGGLIRKYSLVWNSRSKAPRIIIWKATDASDQSLRRSIADSLAGLAAESQITIEKD